MTQGKSAAKMDTWALPSGPVGGALLFLALLPIFLFYLLLFRTLTGLPFLDDYDSILAFDLQIRHLGLAGTLWSIFSFKHTDYLLILQDAIYAIQYKLLGHANLKFLTVCGDLLVLPLFGALWLLWSSEGLPRTFRLAAFVPVSWLLFQLQYASTLNCVMAPLQNIPVVLFTLLAFFYGARTKVTDFAYTLISVILSITASGGGLFVGPVLCLQYIQQRAWKRFFIMAAVSLTVTAVYLHVRTLTGPRREGVGLLYRDFSLPFSAAFLGSFAAASKPGPAIVFAVILLALFLYATKDRLYRRHAGLYYAMLFFFLQALAVSCFRSHRGLETALGSRYRINSDLLVILFYFYLAEKFRQVRLSRTLQVSSIAMLAILLMSFNLACDRAGYRLLHLRRIMLQQAMLQWTHHGIQPAAIITEVPDYMRKNEESGLYTPLEPYLTESLQADIYKIPPPGPNQ